MAIPHILKRRFGVRFPLNRRWPMLSTPVQAHVFTKMWVWMVWAQQKKRNIPLIATMCSRSANFCPTAPSWKWKKTSSRQSTTLVAIITTSIEATTTTRRNWVFSTDISDITEQKAIHCRQAMLPTRCISRQEVFPMWKTSTKITPSTNTSAISNTGFRFVPKTLWWERTTSWISKNSWFPLATARKRLSFGINSVCPCVNMKRRWAQSTTSLPFVSYECLWRISRRPPTCVSLHLNSWEANGATTTITQMCAPISQQRGRLQSTRWILKRMPLVSLWTTFFLLAWAELSILDNRKSPSWMSNPCRWRWSNWRQVRLVVCIATPRSTSAPTSVCKCLFTTKRSLAMPQTFATAMCRCSCASVPMRRTTIMNTKFRWQ